MTTTETITAEIWIDTLEPGTHISRKTLATVKARTITLPRADCSEARADWGEYFPIVTAQATERAIKARGHMPAGLPHNQRYSFIIHAND